VALVRLRQFPHRPAPPRPRQLYGVLPGPERLKDDTDRGFGAGPLWQVTIRSLQLGVEPVGYTEADRAAAFPWNQRRERRAAASTSELDREEPC
jgi:hypothetical protein